MKKLNHVRWNGRCKILKLKNLVFFFLVAVIIMTACFLYHSVEIERQEEHRYQQISHEKEGKGLLKLKRDYKDLIGWLEIKNAEFSYPVMQTKENPEYYLHHDEEGNYSFYGTPFLDARCHLQSDNLIIYGHNINGRRFFGFLQNYREKQFYQYHKDLWFSKGTGKEKRYQIISVIKTDIRSKVYQYTDIYNEDEYWDFVHTILAQSLYHCEMADILEEEMKEKTVEAFFHQYQFLCLSTCRSSEGKDKRLLVIGCRKQ